MSNKSQPNPNNTHHSIPTPAEIVAHLDQYIIGQDDAKRTLACACYCHLHSCAIAESHGESVWTDNHTMIAGPSGTGKSEMIRILCAYLKIPNYQIDCTMLTPAGYKGRGMEVVIDDLEQTMVQDDDSTPPFIVTWDEIDKLWDDGSDAGRYRRMTQADTLKLIEGGKVSENLNTSRILHIACGAFAGMDKIRFPADPPEIGFNPKQFRCVSTSSLHTEQIEVRHFIEFGLIPELVGRFSRFAVTNPLNKTDIMHIMLTSEISFLRRKIEQFQRHGAKLVFSDDAIDELAGMALSHPSGVRGLRQLITQALAPWDFRLAELVTGGVHEIHYDRQAIHDGAKAHVLMGSSPPSPVLPHLTKSQEGRSEPPGDDEIMSLF
ncbi:MAG: AAA family ATPase [Verrucomicrobiota bacterium]